MTMTFSIDLVGMKQADPEDLRLYLAGVKYVVSGTVLLRSGGDIAFTWDSDDLAQAVSDLERKSFFKPTRSLEIAWVPMEGEQGALTVWLRHTDEQLAELDITEVDFVQAVAAARAALREFKETLPVTDQPVTRV